MKRNSSRNSLRILTIAILFAMSLACLMPLAALTSSAESVSALSEQSNVVTTPGSSALSRYFKEDTNYEMSEKIDTPVTIEFEIAACGNIAGASNGGVLLSNYSEDASTYLIIEAETYGKLRVRGKYNGGSEWTAQFYQSEADIRLNPVHHYTFVLSRKTVALYVDGVLKATRYPEGFATLPTATEFDHPFRIGGDYSANNSNYFKGLINSVAIYSDKRTDSEIKADKAVAKTWKNGDNLVAAYDITRMGEAALRDYSGNGNKLVYNAGSGLQVENFGKYEVEQKITTGIETFEAWINVPKYNTNTITGTIMGNYRSYNGARVVVEVYKNGNPRLFYTNANGTVSYHRFTDVDLRTGQWQHLSIVHDVASGEVRCYVDGVLKQTIADTTVLDYADNAYDQNFLIGRDTALRYAEGDGEYWENRKDQYFRGFIKEIRLYSDVRSSEEIAADYAGTLDTKDAGLIACYQMSGEDAYSDITDLSGNGYTAKYKQLLWEAEYVEPIANNYAYSFAIVGDTQTVNDQNPEYLKTIYQWILDNKDSKNIQYVIGLGDITEIGVDVGHKNYDATGSHKQWADAKEAITMMDGIIPYSLIRGDGHDGIELFNQYFGSHAGYTNNISGYFEEGRIDNVYHTFKIGEVDYMLLCLDHGTKDDVLVWANEVVAAHPNHRVIVTTHQYMNSDGTLSERNETGNATAYDPTNNAADDLWNEFLSKHPNICMVMCGHAESDDVVVTKQIGDHGNEVTQILIDPQVMDAEYYQGSKGMVAMLYFSEDGKDVQVQYYSTVKDTYRPTSSFTVDYSTEAHNYNAVVTAPTCTDAGYTTHACSVCEYGYVTDATAALGHTEEPVAGKAPTCTETGLTDGTKCSVCGDVLKVQEDIVPNGHTEESVSGKDATCTENGLTDGKKCSVCGTVIVAQDEIPAKGHTYNPDVTNPDCTNGGYTTYTCAVCGDVKVSDHTDALGHTEETVAGKAPTCAETGLTDGKKCSVCGETLVAQEEIPALGHNYDAEVTAPDCTNGGYTTYTCSVCGDNYASDHTDALGHTEETVAGKAPTCTETGLTDGKKCSVCGETLLAQEEIPANGHNYNAEVTAPDCTNSGYTTYTCSVCGDSYVEDETAALGHTEMAVAGKAPTCTETGLTNGTECSVCGETLLAQTVIPANGHIDENPKDYVCDVCEEDLCTDHTEETISAKAPTCTESGLTEGKKCSVCGDILLPQTEVPALGHNYGAEVTDPDCVNGGYTTYTCSVCGDSYVADETAALGHTWGEATCTAPKTCSVCNATEGEALGHNYNSEVTDPDCTNGGYTTYTCSVCGDSYVADETAALGHTEETVAGKAPTCTETGLTDGKKCSVCGETLVAQEEIPANGHNYEAEVTAPDCTNGGYTTYTCSVCGDNYVADEVEALGHKWLEATTEAPKTCEVCGANEGEKLPEPTPEPDTTPDAEPEVESSVEKNHEECEASEWEKFIMAIINFFKSLLGLPEECVCGEELN